MRAQDITISRNHGKALVPVAAFVRWEDYCYRRHKSAVIFEELSRLHPESRSQLIEVQKKIKLHQELLEVQKKIKLHQELPKELYQLRRQEEQILAKQISEKLVTKQQEYEDLLTDKGNSYVNLLAKRKEIINKINHKLDSSISEEKRKDAAIKAEKYFENRWEGKLKEAINTWNEIYEKATKKQKFELDILLDILLPSNLTLPTYSKVFAADCTVYHSLEEINLLSLHGRDQLRGVLPDDKNGRLAQFITLMAKMKVHQQVEVILLDTNVQREKLNSHSAIDGNAYKLKLRTETAINVETFFVESRKHISIIKNVKNKLSLSPENSNNIVIGVKSQHWNRRKIPTLQEWKQRTQPAPDFSLLGWVSSFFHQTQQSVSILTWINTSLFGLYANDNLQCIELLNINLFLSDYLDDHTAEKDKKLISLENAVSDIKKDFSGTLDARSALEDLHSNIKKLRLRELDKYRTQIQNSLDLIKINEIITNIEKIDEVSALKEKSKQGKNYIQFEKEDLIALAKEKRRNIRLSQCIKKLKKEMKKDLTILKNMDRLQERVEKSEKLVANCLKKGSSDILRRLLRKDIFSSYALMLNIETDKLISILHSLKEFNKPVIEKIENNDSIDKAITDLLKVENTFAGLETSTKKEREFILTFKLLLENNKQLKKLEKDPGSPNNPRLLAHAKSALAKAKNHQSIPLYKHLNKKIALLGKSLLKDDDNDADVSCDDNEIYLPPTRRSSLTKQRDGNDGENEETRTTVISAKTPEKPTTDTESSSESRSNSSEEKNSLLKASTVPTKKERPLITILGPSYHRLFTPGGYSSEKAEDNKLCERPLPALVP